MVIAHSASEIWDFVCVYAQSITLEKVHSKDITTYAGGISMYYAYVLTESGWGWAEPFIRQSLSKTSKWLDGKMALQAVLLFFNVTLKFSLKLWEIDKNRRIYLGILTSMATGFVYS